MFTSAGYKVDSIEYYAPKVVRDGKTLGSDDYASYKITSDGQIYWVTNSSVETESGGEQEVGKKDLTPAKLGLTNKIYKDAASLVHDIDTNLQTITTITDSTRDFLTKIAANARRLPCPTFWPRDPGDCAGSDGSDCQPRCGRRPGRRKTSPSLRRVDGTIRGGDPGPIRRPCDREKSCVAHIDSNSDASPLDVGSSGTFARNGA